MASKATVPSAAFFFVWITLPEASRSSKENWSPARARPTSVLETDGVQEPEASYVLVKACGSSRPS